MSNSLFNSNIKQPEPDLAYESEPNDELFLDAISHTYHIAPVVISSQKTYDFLNLLLIYKAQYGCLNLGGKTFRCPMTGINFHFDPDNTSCNTNFFNYFNKAKNQFSDDKLNETGFPELPLDDENFDVIKKLFECLPDPILKKYILAASPEKCSNDEESFKSRTLLHWAIYHNEIDIVNKIIDLHPRCLLIDDVNNMDTINEEPVSAKDNAHNHALLYACRINEPDSAMAIIEKLTNWGELEIKEKLGNDFCIQKYLSNRDCSEGDEGDCKYLSPFHWACYYGEVTLVKRIFEAYPDICETEEPSSDNALSIACQQGKLEVVKVIVENVSNWKTQSLYLGNVLNAACYHKQVGIVEYILEKDEDNICLNAKIDTSDFYNNYDSIGNALHKICEIAREPKIARLLLNKSPELIRVTDNLGNTPLHIAFACHDLDMIKLLLEYATEEDLNIENEAGKTIRQLAQWLKESLKGEKQSVKDKLEEALLPINLGAEPSTNVLN